MVFARKMLWYLTFILMVNTALGQNNPTVVARVQDKFSRAQHFSMEQGLSNNSINSIAQDEEGFMWFATEDGLSRFDGEQFLNFFYRPDGTGLPANFVQKIVLLTNNRLLIGTSRGLCVMDTRRLLLSRVKLMVSPNQPSNDIDIKDLLLDSQQRVWVASTAGAFLLNNQLEIQAAHFKPKQTQSPNSNFSVTELLEIHKDLVVAKITGIGKGFTWQVLDFQSDTTASLAQKHPEYAVFDSIQAPLGAIRYGQDFLISCSPRGYAHPKILKFNTLTKTTEVFFENQEQGYFVRPRLLPDNALLLERRIGSLAILDIPTKTLVDLPNWTTSWPDGSLATHFVDKKGGLWYCPRFKGIFYHSFLPPSVFPFAELNQAHRQLVDKKLVADEWFGFSSNKVGERWFLGSSNGGTYCFDTQTKQITTIFNQKFKGIGYIWGFAPHTADTLWLTTLEGLYWLNTKNLTFAPLKRNGTDSAGRSFLFRDSHGLIWGKQPSNGVLYFDNPNRNFHRFPSQGEQAPFPMVNASSFAENREGTEIWFADPQEPNIFVKWERKTGIFHAVKPKNNTGLACTKAWNLRMDGEDFLWIPTREAVFRMNTKTYEVEVIGLKNGLNSNVIEGFTPDKNGNMWLATSHGLSRFDIKTHSIRTFYKADGLPSNVISNVELLDTAKNLLLISTAQGVSLFEPDKLDLTPTHIKTSLTSLWVSDSSYPLPDNTIWYLSHHENSLKIGFTSINYRDGGSNRYQYRLMSPNTEGGWKDAGTDNFANFLNLQSGKYEFYVRVANTDGVWSEDVAHLTIIIYPPWWRTWTFQLSLLVGFVALGWWLYQRQIRAIEERENEKNQFRQQLADLEMKALRAQMNPHFVFNALNSVQNFILKNDTREASRYLTKFARLMRLILENSESPVVPLSKEIELLKHYVELESLRFNQRFNFLLEIDPSVNAESISVPSMLIQPHIENAIWHGLMHKSEVGTLILRFKKSSDTTIDCEIEDNGIGRVAANELNKNRQKTHRSTGLANIRHRLALLNVQLTEDIRLDFVDLSDAEGKAAGTKVVVKMPIILRG